MTNILCDFDGEFPDDFVKRLELVSRLQRLRVQWWRVDRTRHGHHVVIAVSNRLGAVRVVLIQALLGSDWKRETYNSRRALLRALPRFWRKRRNVLYHRHYRRVSV